MNTRINLNIGQRAVALQLALKQLRTWGIAIAIDPLTVEPDSDVRFLQFRRAACAMLGIPDNSANLALNDVYEIARLIQLSAEAT